MPKSKPAPLTREEKRQMEEWRKQEQLESNEWAYVRVNYKRKLKEAA